MKVVGWKGALFPVKLNIRNILPIMSDRIHIPPSSWATFEAPGMDEVMLTQADEDPAARRSGSFRHTPQGSCTEPTRPIAPNSAWSGSTMSILGWIASTGG